jgi:hypothetical protein
MSTNVHRVGPRAYLKKLREYHQVKKCRHCECLQGALVWLQVAEGDEVDAEIKVLLVGHNKIHSCLGCDPCPPVGVLVDYLVTDWRR